MGWIWLARHSLPTPSLKDWSNTYCPIFSPEVYKGEIKYCRESTLKNIKEGILLLGEIE